MKADLETNPFVCSEIDIIRPWFNCRRALLESMSWAKYLSTIRSVDSGLPNYKCFHKSQIIQNEKVALMIWEHGMKFQCAKTLLSFDMNGCKDIKIWMGSPNGKYIVKVGYLKEINDWEPPFFQSVYPLQWWWKFMGNLHIHPKVHIFFVACV